MLLGPRTTSSPLLWLRNKHSGNCIKRLSVLHRPAHSARLVIEGLISVDALLLHIHTGHNCFSPYAHSESRPHASSRTFFCYHMPNLLFSDFPTFQPNCHSLSTNQFIYPSDHLSIQTEWTTRRIAQSSVRWEDVPSIPSHRTTPEWGWNAASRCCQHTVQNYL